MGCFPLLVIIFLSWQIGFHYKEIIQSQFWPNFWPDFAAAVAGILIALWIDRLVRKEQEKKEILKSDLILKQKKKQLITAIKSNLEQNIDFIQTMRPTIEKGIIPMVLPDISLLLATQTMRYELIEDMEFNSNIDSIQLALSTIQNGLEKYLQATVPNNNMPVEYIRELRSFISKNLDSILIVLKENVAVLEENQL